MFKIYILLFSVLVLSSCHYQPTPNEQVWINKGFNLKEQKPWIYYGFDENISKKYADAGLSAQETAIWNKAMYSPQESAKWIKVSSQPSQIDAWNKNFFTPAQYLQYKDLNIIPSKLRQYFNNGYNVDTTIVLNTLNYSTKEANKFFNHTLHYTPLVYKNFGNEIYDFEKSCKTILSDPYLKNTILNLSCINYLDDTQESQHYGYLLDNLNKQNEYMNLKYLEELRDLDTEKYYILRTLKTYISKAVDKKEFTLFRTIFLLLEDEPTKKEMCFINHNSLDLEHTSRFASYTDQDFWEAKKKQDKLLQEEIEKQKKILAKKRALELKRLREQEKIIKAARAIEEKKARKIRQKNKKLEDEAKEAKNSRICKRSMLYGDKKIHSAQVYGTIKYIITEQGSRLHGYIVQNYEDHNLYFIRDPRYLAKLSSDDIDKKVSWIVRTSPWDVNVQTTSTRAFFDINAPAMPMSKFMRTCEDLE